MEPQPTKVRTVVSIIIIVILVLALGLFIYVKGWFGSRVSTTENNGNTVACTQDAMQCPDGSYVGRVPPSCNFAPCPASATDTAPANAKG